MKSKIIGILLFLIMLCIAASGQLANIVNFFIWLVTLNFRKSSVSIAGDIFVRLATFLISYSAVGVLFNVLGWFNSKAMRAIYFIISTFISFVLCYIVMLFETYLLYFVIVFGVLFALVILTIIILYIKDKRKREIQPQQKRGLK